MKAITPLGHHYAERGWLESVAYGVYRLPLPRGAAATPTADWVVPLLSAQWLGYDAHIGGPTALTLHGYTQYLTFGEQAVAYLYSDKPPSWMKRIGLNSDLRLRSKKLFTDPEIGLEQTRPSDQGGRLTAWEQPVTLSTPERTIIETLDELPRNEGFGRVDAAFESLTNLRPRVLTTLLMDCRSVKVKRLSFVYADKHAHAWHKHLDPKAFGLGSGDCALTPGGRLHPQYRITIPDLLMPCGPLRILP